MDYTIKEVRRIPADAGGTETFGWFEDATEASGDLDLDAPAWWLLLGEDENGDPDHDWPNPTASEVVSWHYGSAPVFSSLEAAESVRALLGGDDRREIEPDMAATIHGAPYGRDGEAVDLGNCYTIGDVAGRAFYGLRAGQHLDLIDGDGTLIARWACSADGQTTYRCHMGAP